MEDICANKTKPLKAIPLYNKLSTYLQLSTRINLAMRTLNPEREWGEASALAKEHGVSRKFRSQLQDWCFLRWNKRSYQKLRTQIRRINYPSEYTKYLQMLLDAILAVPILLFCDRAPWPRGKPIEKLQAQNPRLQLV